MNLMNLILVSIGILLIILISVQIIVGKTGYGYLVDRKKSSFWYWVTVLMWSIVCICALIVGFMF